MTIIYIDILMGKNLVACLKLLISAPNEIKISNNDFNYTEECGCL